MATSTQIDHGDYVETITGEPTWDNPTTWRSSEIAWKQDTAGYDLAQATSALGALTGQVQANVTQAQADAAAWPTADAAARDEIMGRVLAGLATLTGALGELGVHLGIGQ